MCESFKFVRLYPLNQQDLPNEFKVIYSIIYDRVSYLQFKEMATLTASMCRNKKIDY